MTYENQLGRRALPPNQCEAVREGDIPSGCSRIEGTIEALHQNLEALVKRLDPILRADPPADVNELIKHSGPCTPLGHKLSMLNDGVRNAERVVNGLLSRIEL